ncbi:MAG: type II toxin-antitoxin system VapC family toxin [Actinobacteria bacterium]|nr:type II toxin-antitoxin system VapC family toxin [Actinomycetota bacterium]
MRVLLDTHVVLWWLADETDRFSEQGWRVLDDPTVDAVVSAVTVWEIAIKRGLGKLDAPADIVAQLDNSPVELLPITARHADLVSKLPDLHRDPFDRLLIAQAKIERLAVATADEVFGRYSVEVLW